MVRQHGPDGRLILVVAVILLVVFFNLPEKSHAASDYYVASMNMTIDPGAEDFVVSSINDATSSGAHHFILVMNTFGGSGSNMDHIITAIETYEGIPGNNFMTLLAPPGAHAFSAGAYIAEASNNITMVPGTTIGSATPIVYGIPTGQENTTLTKDINGFAAFMAGITGQNHRNATAAALMVTKGKSYECQSVTSCLAKQLGVIDRVVNATSLTDALTAAGAPAGVEVHSPGIRSLFLSVLSDPNLDSVLFLLGTFAILADIYHPTIVLSVVGASAIALGLLGLGVFGASIIAIILMVIGAAFVFLELKTHHGLSATIGVVIFIVGFLLVFTLPAPASPPPSAPASHPAGNFIQIGLLTYVILGIIGGGGVLGSIYLYRIRETLMHQPPTIDPKAIIGKQGELTTDWTAGEVATAHVNSEDYTVTGSENLSKGTKIRVKDVQGLKLIIEKVEAAA
jgi:membrane-bound serine protease (ClpP class)